MTPKKLGNFGRGSNIPKQPAQEKGKIWEGSNIPKAAPRGVKPPKK
jgi:hypothetical protein